MHRLFGAVGFYFLVCVLYALFSFSLTDPNLVLISWAPYWQFQQWMWQTFFLNHQLLTVTYTLLIVLFFAAYINLFLALKQTWRDKEISLSWHFVLRYAAFYLLLISPLLFSYNALSHDVFNYIFNAKMVMVYGANPHQQVALDYSFDPWTRFMHNTHTPAPYGQGWTLLSLAPYVLGGGKFILTWLSFRWFNVLGMFGAYLAMLFLIRSVQPKIHKVDLLAVAAVFLNPLWVIELISNDHNDMWMMAPAVFALALVIKKRPRFGRLVALSAVLLVFSISIKLATLLLLPIWAVLIWQNWDIWAGVRQKLNFLQPSLAFMQKYWAELAVILLFLPLLSSRSQQFNPWYLTWILLWLPFLKWRCLKVSLMVLSVSSLLRYLPWLWNGDFTPQIVLQQKMITWIPLLVFLTVLVLYKLWRKISRKSF